MDLIKNISLVFALLLGLSNQNAYSQIRQERIMTIQELAESVQENNIQLKLANTAVNIADARIGKVKTNRLPDLGANVSAFYLSDVSVYDTGFKKTQTLDLPNFGNKFDLSASQLLFAGGKINKSIALAELGKTLSVDQLGDIDQGIKLSAAELYLNLYNLQNQKQILIKKQGFSIRTHKEHKVLL